MFIKWCKTNHTAGIPYFYLRKLLDWNPEFQKQYKLIHNKINGWIIRVVRIQTFLVREIASSPCKRNVLHEVATSCAGNHQGGLQPCTNIMLYRSTVFFRPINLWPSSFLLCQCSKSKTIFTSRAHSQPWTPCRSSVTSTPIAQTRGPRSPVVW